MQLNKQLKKFILFISILASLMVALDFLVTLAFDALYVRINVGENGGEINRYLAAPGTPDLLIIGNSRARYHIDPDSFNVTAYSLCHAGMSQVFHTNLLHVLRSKNKLPPAILLHVDFRDYMDEDDIEDIGNLRYYYGKSPEVTEAINSVSRYERVKYILGFYRYNGRVITTLKNYVQTRSPVTVGNGFEPLEPTSADSARLRNMPSVNKRFHYENLRHLEGFIKTCRRNNVKLLCFSSPYYSKPNYVYVAEKIIDSLLTSERVPFLNAAAEVDPALTSVKFWRDREHLNSLGAPYLSRQVAQWCIPYLTTDRGFRRQEQQNGLSPI